VGIPTLQAQAGDVFSGGVANLAVNRTIHLRNNGFDWSAVGT